MSPYRSDFLATLHMRGFIDNCTDPEGLDAAFREGCLSAYIGFDCTAPSLHVGSLMQMLALRWLQETGSRPIVLMGGGTTRIGDPSGKDETRKLLEPSAIAANMGPDPEGLPGRSWNSATGRRMRWWRTISNGLRR